MKLISVIWSYNTLIIRKVQKICINKRSVKFIGTFILIKLYILPFFLIMFKLWLRLRWNSNMKGGNRSEKKEKIGCTTLSRKWGRRGKTVLFERTGKGMISLSFNRVCSSIAIEDGSRQERWANLLPRSDGIKETICKLALGVAHTEHRF